MFDSCSVIVRFILEKETITMKYKWNLSLCLLLSCMGITNGAQCKKQPKKENDKLIFEPLNGEMQPSTLSTEYDAKGLQPFFNLANSFMNTVQSKKLSDEFRGCKYLLSLLVFFFFFFNIRTFFTSKTRQ